MTESPSDAAGHVLVIDDAPMVIQVLTRALEGERWKVVTASSGTGGIEAFEAARPEVVVCDLHMPDLDGYQVLDRIRELDPSVPVLFLSADENRAAMVEAIRRGGFDFILKSDLGPLLGAIERGATWSRGQRQLRVRAQALEAIRPKLLILKRLSGLLGRAVDGTREDLVRTIDKVQATTDQILELVD